MPVGQNYHKPLGSESPNKLKQGSQTNKENSMDFDNVMKQSTDFKPATYRQMQALSRFGYTPKRKISFGEASKVLDTLVSRAKQGLCTLKQARVLKDNGIDPKEVSFEEASKLLDSLINGDQAIAY